MSPGSSRRSPSVEGVAELSDRDGLRAEVYERDAYRCQHCGQQGAPGDPSQLRVRHIVPKSRGGTTHPRNLVTVCRTCRGRVSEHHRMGSADRVALGTRSQPSEPGSMTAGDTALLFFGGVLIPFVLTLFVMTLNVGFP